MALTSSFAKIEYRRRAGTSLPIAAQIVGEYGEMVRAKHGTISNELVTESPIEWEPLALALRHKLEAQFPTTTWPQCACNLYPDEAGAIGPHHDKGIVADGKRREPLHIASVSLGAERKMVLIPPKANLKSAGDTVDALMRVPGAIGIDLPSGSLLLFSNAFNSAWKHSIPRDDVKCTARISLTYRSF